jgi:flagellar biosynthetic protein FliR
VLTWFSQIFWSMLRVGGFFMVVPVFGNALVSPRIKVALTLSVSLLIAPTLTPMPVLSELSIAMAGQVGIQMLAGIGLGFATMIFYQLFVVAGQFIGMQMGLGFASMVDPGSGVQVTVWSQFFLLLVTLTFLAINGHLVLIDVLVTGFTRFPTGLGLPIDEFAYQIAALGGWMFAGGMLVALPAVLSLLVVNIAFGVMSRSAPQLNVFSLGFPFALVFGLVIVWFSLQGWLPQFERLSESFFATTVEWVS